MHAQLEHMLPTQDLCHFLIVYHVPPDPTVYQEQVQLLVQLVHIVHQEHKNLNNTFAHKVIIALLQAWQIQASAYIVVWESHVHHWE